MSSKIYDTKKSKEELDKAKEKTKNLIDKIPKIGKIKKEIAKGAVDYTIDKAEHVWENTGMKKKQDDTDTWVDEFLNGGPKLPENQPEPTSNAEPTPNNETNKKETGDTGTSGDNNTGNGNDGGNSNGENTGNSGNKPGGTGNTGVGENTGSEGSGNTGSSEDNGGSNT